MEKEQYVPSSEESKKAEEMMSEEEKKMSEEEYPALKTIENTKQIVIGEIQKNIDDLELRKQLLSDDLELRKQLLSKAQLSEDFLKILEKSGNIREVIKGDLDIYANLNEEEIIKIIDELPLVKSYSICCSRKVFSKNIVKKLLEKNPNVRIIDADGRNIYGSHRKIVKEVGQELGIDISHNID